MKIKIKDTDKVPVWGLPEAGLHLSFENNGPLPITLSKLAPLHRKIIYLNIASGILEADDIRELEQFVFQKPSGTRMEEDLSIIKKGRKSVDMVAKAGKLKKLLSNSVSTLRRLLPEYGMEDLDVLLNLEKNSKNRKTVIKLIDTLKDKIIEGQDKSVAASVGRSAGDIPTQSWRSDLKGVEKVFENNLDDIEESEEEDIIIHIGDEDSS
jgi:hypothetical protein